MSITVKYFASLREIMGREEDILEITEKTITVSDIWNQMTGQKEVLPGTVLTAVNQEYVKPDAMVKDGDEVAFFPPVTGG